MWRRGLSCGLTDFSPLAQDIAALYLIDRRRAMNAVLEGDWKTALERCNREWASLPGSPYGQPTKTLETCLSFLYANMKKEEAPAPVPFPQPKLEKPSWFRSLLRLFRR